MQKTLDLAIKKYEMGTMDGFYSQKKQYSSYMKEAEWKSFENDMEQNYPTAFEKYGAGSGGEMKEGAKYPPKMASYGSSSRMIFNLSKHLCKFGFQFEYKLPTRVGGIANLDGFMQKGDRYIFIEAKCREPYGEKSHLIEDAYKDLYEYINKDSECNLDIKYQAQDKKIKVDFSAGNIKINRHDIKQMICHLLGIAVKFLNNPTDKKISFLYLCYNPNLIAIDNEKHRNKISHIYGEMCKECHTINYQELFRVIMMYLYQKHNVGIATIDEINKMIDNFEFDLCDQSNYLSHLN